GRGVGVGGAGGVRGAGGGRGGGGGGGVQRHADRRRRFGQRGVAAVDVQVHRADADAIAVADERLGDGLSVEQHRQVGGELAQADAVGGTSDQGDDRRQGGAGQGQVAAGDAADEELPAGDLGPGGAGGGRRPPPG